MYTDVFSPTFIFSTQYKNSHYITRKMLYLLLFSSHETERWQFFQKKMLQLRNLSIQLNFQKAFQLENISLQPLIDESQKFKLLFIIWRGKVLEGLFLSITVPLPKSVPLTYLRGTHQCSPFYLLKKSENISENIWENTWFLMFSGSKKNKHWSSICKYIYLTLCIRNSYNRYFSKIYNHMQ